MNTLIGFVFGFLLVSARFFLKLADTPQETEQYLLLQSQAIIMPVIYSILYCLIKAVMFILVCLQKIEQSENYNMLASALSLILVFTLFAYIPIPPNILHFISSLF